MNHTKTSVGTLVLVLSLASHGARAESSAGFDPFATALSGSTILGTGTGTSSSSSSGASGVKDSDFTNGISAGAAKKAMVDKSNVQDHSADNAQNGREYKAGDAENQSNNGKTAAIVAGTGMVAAAIPLLASIIPAEVAAGADLMAKAGLEFAQAAADSKAAKENKAQKDLLKAQANQNGEEAKGDQASGGSSGSDNHTSDAQQALSSNPQLQNFLASRGINSDDFINKLASGQIRDPQAALSAVGNTTDISPEAQAQGASIAQASAPPEPKGNSEQMRILNDDSAKPRDLASAGAGAGDGGGSAGGGAAGTSKAGQPSGGDAAGAGGLAAATTPARLAALLGASHGGDARAAGARTASAGDGGDSDMMSALMRMMGLGGNDGASAAAKRAVVAEQLARMGIIRLNPKQNIFQLAHRNYRSFQKWRRQTRVAQNVR